MTARPLIAALLALLVAAAWSAQPTTMDEANRAYYLGRYAHALALYERLAAAGHAEAAERAGFMRLEGGAMYGAQVGRDLGKAAAWLTQAARSGRPGAGFVLNMLDGAD